MKKVSILCLFIIISIALSSCNLFCAHSWTDATCSAPKTCILCSKTKGAPSPHAHNWKEATCQSPKTCTDCGKIEGKVLENHTFKGGTCIYCNAVQLNLTNYKNYIDYHASASAEGRLSSYSSYYYTSAKCAFEVTGNSHYRYKDVEIVVNFLGYDREGYVQYLGHIIDPVKFEKATPYSTGKCYVNLNYAGNGSDTCTIRVNPDDYASSSDIKTRTVFEVVSISGIVEEY